MMRVLTAAIIVLVTVASCKRDPSYIIHGNISGADNRMVYLEKRESGSWVILDSATVEHEMFEFAGRVSYPSPYYIRIIGKRGYRMFFLENSDIYISGSADSLYNVSVTGSHTNDEFELYASWYEELYEKNLMLTEEEMMAVVAADVASVARIESERRQIQEDIVTLQMDFVSDNPSSYASPVILRSLASSLDAATLDSMVNLLDPALSRTETVRYLRNMIERMKLLEEGSVAPTFSQADRDGKIFTLDELRGEGILLIYFWASWSSQSRAVIPEFIRMYNRYHKSGLNIVGISLDSSGERWEEAVTEDKSPWIQLSDLNHWNNEVAITYNIIEIPSFCLIDRQGRIALSGKDIDNLEQTIRGLLTD